jgi:hypothetical protein
MRGVCDRGLAGEMLGVGWFDAEPPPRYCVLRGVDSSAGRVVLSLRVFWRQVFLTPGCRGGIGNELV